MRFLLTVLLYTIVSLSARPAETMAYVDRIGAPAEEVAGAARRVAQQETSSGDIGGEHEVQTAWIEDTAEKERSVWLLGPQNQKVARRFKITYFIVPGPSYTEVRVSGDFQYRSLSASRATPWRSHKASRSERSLERAWFYKLLHELESDRQG